MTVLREAKRDAQAVLPYDTSRLTELTVDGTFAPECGVAGINDPAAQTEEYLDHDSLRSEVPHSPDRQFIWPGVMEL